MQEETLEGRILRDTKTNEAYLIKRIIGSGSFSQCYEAISETNGQLIAIKVVKTDLTKDRYRVLMEIKIHRSLKHQHIIAFHDAFENNNNMYIFLEHGGNLTLKQFLSRKKTLTEQQTKQFIQQLVRALKYLHSQLIIHRDLKPANILINSKMEVKICDFGLSTRLESKSKKKKTFCGTPNYMAPEIVSKSLYSFQVDVWSLGAIIYQLLTGIPPFQGSTVHQTYNNILNLRYQSKIKLSPLAQDLIDNILVLDPEKRLKLPQILCHKFLTAEECCQKLIQPIVQPQKLQIFASEFMIQSLQKLNKSIPYTYIKQCFFAGDILGYLLSNGSMGVFCKNGINLIVQAQSNEYYIIMKNKKPANKLDSSTQKKYAEYLFNFKTYFLTKYTQTKLIQLKEQSKQTDNKLIYIRKCLKIEKNQILTRLNNKTTQLHFKDNSNVCLQLNANEGIYFTNETGQSVIVRYSQCSNELIKSKVQKISQIISRFSNSKKSSQ